jgi:HEAT repeat protein
MTPPHSRTVAVNLGLLAALVAVCGAWYWLEKGPLGVQHWADALARNHPRRFEAAGALRELGRKAHAAVPALLRVLDDPSDPLAPTAAAALVHVDAERGYEFAQALAGRGELGGQTVAIFGELGAVSWQAAPMLRRALADPNTREPERVIWALLRMGDFSSDVMAAIVRDSKDPRYGVRWESAMQLEYLGPRARPLRGAVEQLAFDATPAVAGRAKMILAELDKTTPYARSGLARFPTQDESYQEYALIRLAKLGPEAADAMNDVTGELQGKSVLLRFLATRTLASMGSAAKPALPALQRARQDPSNLVRDGARVAIEAIQ